MSSAATEIKIKTLYNALPGNGNKMFHEALKWRTMHCIYSVKIKLAIRRKT
jgi:hypothetical protein